MSNYTISDFRDFIWTDTELIVKAMVCLQSIRCKAKIAAVEGKKKCHKEMKYQNKFILIISIL